MSDHDNQQHTPDPDNEEQVKAEKDTTAGPDGIITEEALSHVLNKDSAEDVPQREDASQAPASDSGNTDIGTNTPDMSEPSEIDADDITLAEAAITEEEALPEDESHDPPFDNVKEAGGDEVTVTVNRLQELGELLKELNFREMILRFGELQAELDALRDGIRKLKILGEQETPERAAETEVDLQDTLRSAADQMAVAADQLAAFSAWTADGQVNCVELATQVMDSLEALKQSHAARLAMAGDLSDMVESDATNEQLASAALEFAVFLREIDAAHDMEAFDIAFAELKTLYGDMKKVSRDGDNVGELVDNLKRQALDIRGVGEEISSLQRFHREGRSILKELSVDVNDADAFKKPDGEADSSSVQAESAEDLEAE